MVEHPASVGFCRAQQWDRILRNINGVAMPAESQVPPIESSCIPSGVHTVSVRA
jgi:hypothetical protein